MANEQEMEKISKLVDQYNEKHFADDEGLDGIENFSSDSPEVKDAVEEMGITLEKYKEWERWWKASFSQFEREGELAQNFDLTEEELRDEDNPW